jgi:hypothetical protein
MQHLCFEQIEPGKQSFAFIGNIPHINAVASRVVEGRYCAAQSGAPLLHRRD